MVAAVATEVDVRVGMSHIQYIYYHDLFMIDFKKLI
jgi:hypothetical protein